MNKKQIKEWVIYTFYRNYDLWPEDVSRSIQHRLKQIQKNLNKGKSCIWKICDKCGKAVPEEKLHICSDCEMLYCFKCSLTVEDKHYCKDCMEERSDGYHSK